MSDFFWTDLSQASDRLSGCYIPYKDGVVYVRDVQQVPATFPNLPPSPVAVVDMFPPAPNRQRTEIPLDDPGFFRFRKTLPKGWVNSHDKKNALYVSRTANRTTKHGFTTSNTKVGYLDNGRLYFNDYNITVVAPDEGYKQALNKDFPTLKETLECIRKSSVIAINDKAAVAMDAEQFRWLFFGRNKVGVFTGADSLLLMNKYAYLKEELYEMREMAISTIKEF